MDATNWAAIASIISSILTLIGVIVTVEHGNKVRDVQTDNKITSLQNEMNNSVTNMQKDLNNSVTSLQKELNSSISNIEKVVNGLEKKQDAYNNVIARMYEAERRLDVMESKQQDQSDDLSYVKNALGNWRVNPPKND